MRVLLVPPTFHYPNPQPLSFSDFPAAFGYLAAALRAAGHEVVGLNPNNITGYPSAKLMLADVLSKKIRETKPGLIGFGGLCTDYAFLRDAINITRSVDPQTPIVLGGQIVTNDAEWIYNDLKPSAVVKGEGEHAIVALANGELPIRGEVASAISKHHTLDDLSFPDYSPFGIDDMLDNHSMDTRLLYRYSRPNPRPFTIVGSRGCPFNCLQGDTLIDTLEGQIAIKHLVGRTDVKVLTRNPRTQRVEYAAAPLIDKTGSQKRLVRVHFDSGTYIDCTPDHRFLGFTNGSRNPHEREIEARNLQPGQSVRAVKYRMHPIFGYIDVEYGRRFSAKQQRLVMEGYLGRPLEHYEHVHHKDHNKANNVIGNLQLVNFHDHTHLYHPEVAERMRGNNPMRRLDVKERQAATLKANIATGKVVPFMCTPEGRATMSRINREIALSEDNHAKQHARKVRASLEVNHKVTRVEALSQREDVYCMAVPGYDWFFANGVLVHNCSFCIHGHRSTPYRARSIPNIMAEIKQTYEHYHYNVLIILDELFAVNKQRMTEFCEAIIQGKQQYGWDFDWMFQTHASAKLDLDTLQLAKRAGCFFFSYGLESASPRVLQSMNKKIKPGDVMVAMDLARQAKVGFGANLIFGDPAETEETWSESMAFWFANCQDNFVFLANMMPYPGSKVFETCRERGMFQDKRQYYENIDKGVVNMTAIPDNQFRDMMNITGYLEQAWAFVKPATNVNIVLSGPVHQITAACPYCGEESTYRQHIPDPSKPFRMGIGCTKCHRRIRVDVPNSGHSPVESPRPS